MANLFGAGDEELIADKLKKLMAVRIYEDIRLLAMLLKRNQIEH